MLGLTYWEMKYFESRMINGKAILTYKRKRSLSHSDPVDGNGENLSSKSPKRVHSTGLSQKYEPGSAFFGEQFKGDYQYDDAGGYVQQQIQESDVLKCRSSQGSESGLTKFHSYNTRSSKARLETDASLTEDPDSVCMDAKSVSKTGSRSNKESSESESLGRDIAERSTLVSFYLSADRNCTSGCGEDSVLRTLVTAERVLPLEDKTGALRHATVHKENMRTPLLTFCRRAKKRKDVSDAAVQSNLKTEGNEGAKSDQSMILIDTNCKNEVPRDQSKLAPVFDGDDADSNLSLLHLNGKCMAENFGEDANHEPNSTGGSVENKPEGSVLCCTDRLNFITNETTSVLEEMPLKIRADCSSNDSMHIFSSEMNHKDKEAELPAIGTPIREEPGISLIDAVQQPSGREITDVVLESEEHNRQSKGLELLEALGAKKEKTICSAAQVDINSREAFSERDMLYQMSINSSLPDPNAQDFSRETTNQVASFGERNFMQNMGDPIFESQQRVRTARTFSTDFLGSTVKRPDDFQSIAPTLSLGHFQRMLSLGGEGNGHTPGTLLPGKVLDSGSSFFRRKQLVDDILTSSRMLSKRPAYSFVNSRKYLSSWSEEELDSLWIGVRRHGRGNWNSMLGDPRLHFSSWRIAEDLAERWDMEQSRLMNAPSVQPVRFVEPAHSPSSFTSGKLLPCSAVGSYSFSGADPPSQFQGFKNETELSLADVYFRKEGKTLDINRIQLPDLSPVQPLVTNASLGTGSYVYAGHQRNPFASNAGTGNQRLGRAQRSRYAWGQSMLEQNSVERLSPNGQQMPALSARTNLPHWLREVLGTPTPPSDTPLHSSVSASGNSSVPLYSDQRAVLPFPCPDDGLIPVKETHRGILKRRGTSGNSAGGSKALKLASPACDSFSGPRFNPPSLGLSTLNPMFENKGIDPNILDLNRSSSEPIDQQNLVILDSDASSEETISDDQSRP